MGALEANQSSLFGAYHDAPSRLKRRANRGSESVDMVDQLTKPTGAPAVGGKDQPGSSQDPARRVLRAAARGVRRCLQRIDRCTASWSPATAPEMRLDFSRMAIVVPHIEWNGIGGKTPDLFDGRFRRVDDLEQAEIFLVDQPSCKVDESMKAVPLVPIITSRRLEAYDRLGIALAGLRQGQNFKAFICVPKPPGNKAMALASF